MFYLIKVISISDWLRIVLVYSHVVICAFAITAVLKTDLKIVLGNTTREEIKAATAQISGLLLALWVTGLSIIYLDTGFSPEILITKGKLLLKLACVVTLTVNGAVLHYLSFPILMRSRSDLACRESALLVVTGALSTSHWMLAAFVGMSAPLGRLPFSLLFSGYRIFVLSVVAVSLFFIPVISRVSLAHLPRHSS